METVTEKDRMDFLKRQGWREDLTQAEKDRIEAAWTDTDIEMAIALNLA